MRYFARSTRSCAGSRAAASATYGQVAEIAGIPNGGRIGAAALKQGARLPWQRVIGKAGKTRGRIAIHDPIGAALQRELLEREGVEVGDKGLISLSRFAWSPEAGGTRPRLRPGTRSDAPGRRSKRR